MTYKAGTEQPACLRKAEIPEPGRDKQAMTFNLNEPNSLGIVKRLAAKADVGLQTFAQM